MTMVLRMRPGGRKNAFEIEGKQEGKGPVPGMKNTMDRVDSILQLITECENVQIPGSLILAWLTYFIYFYRCSRYLHRFPTCSFMSMCILNCLQSSTSREARGPMPLGR